LHIGRVGFDIKLPPTFGGMCSWRRVAVARVFAGLLWCWDILFGYKFIALAKTVTPAGGPRREPGRPAPPLKLFHFDHEILAVQKPIAYTDLLQVVFILV
jgi:hypothetical protein